MRGILEAAVTRRGNLLGPSTDGVRLVDGAGDGLDGIILETFGGHWLLSTPTADIPPQAVSWLRAQGRDVHWKRLDRHHKESPQALCGPAVDSPFGMVENGMAFEISFESGYSQGIFLDQRDNRAEVRRRAAPGLRVLNTFAYTGAFSVAAALGGAETTTLDLSQPYLDWAKRNFARNGLDPAAHHFCKGDTFHWLRRFARQGRRFDAVILDPPTFSRDERGRVFRIERDFGELAGLAAAVLAPQGWLLCCTNFRGITPRGFEREILAALGRKGATRHARMPEDFTGEAYLKSLWVDL